ncbi:MAG: hypothetical protein HYX35_06180 [Proteobacteria bacterium]|nr:hypothetical protein [Pseudomonadota bacterium]
MTKTFLPMLATIAFIAGTSGIEAQPVPTCSDGCAIMNASWVAFCSTITPTDPAFSPCMTQGATALNGCVTACLGTPTSKAKK